MNGPVASVWLIVAALVATITIFPILNAIAAPERRVVIEIREFEFVPERSQVNPGDVVVWKNVDIVPHTVTSKDDRWDSGLIETGGKWEMLITDDMVEEYFCRFHPSMIASLNIESE